MKDLRKNTSQRDVRRALLGVALLVVGFLASVVEAQQQTVGLLQNDDGAFEGYTLFVRQSYGVAYLVDNHGLLVHSWAVGGGLVVYLNEDGKLIRGPNGVAEFD